ncbi:MAG: hypothetical protein MUC69_05910 [Gemmatimonadales bacterium]|jgi:hypothetical protein|nr:hypothetical protein [Gemmatimonadales bacterium]
MPETPANDSEQGAGSWLLVALAWTAVGLPLLWGVWQTFKKAAQLFR